MFGQFPGELEDALILGAFAFAGAGGTNNLVQSNWIRDKGFGMGRHAPRIVSPITGEEEAAPTRTCAAGSAGGRSPTRSSSSPSS
jgi:hypothetical protein